MAGTIVVDRIESDASYASNINVASQITFSNTVNFGITSVAPVAGFYSPSTNNVAFTTASTERMRISPSGNVLIGTTTTQTGAVLAVTGGIQGTITSGTTVASTSGTSIDFTGIPSWVKRITVMFNEVSTSGSAYKYIRLGTSGGIVSSNYGSASSLIYGANNCAIDGTGTAFLIRSDVATERISGHAVLTLVDASNYIWSFSSIVSNTTATNRVWHSGGSLSLGGVCTQIRLLTSNGSDTFDNGSVNILYEG